MSNDDIAIADAPLFSCQHMGRETELHLHAFANAVQRPAQADYRIPGKQRQPIRYDTCRPWNLLNKALQAEDS